MSFSPPLPFLWISLMGFTLKTWWLFRKTWWSSFTFTQQPGISLHSSFPLLLSLSLSSSPTSLLWDSGIFLGLCSSRLGYGDWARVGGCESFTGRVLKEQFFKKMKGEWENDKRRDMLCRQKYSSYVFTEMVPKGVSTQALGYKSWCEGVKGGGHPSADSENNGEKDDEGVAWRGGQRRRNENRRRTWGSVGSAFSRVCSFKSSTCMECQHKRGLLGLLNNGARPRDTN